MIELGQHAQFIVSAYIGVFACLFGLAAWAVVDARRTRRRLEELGESQRGGSR